MNFKKVLSAFNLIVNNERGSLGEAQDYDMSGYLDGATSDGDQVSTEESTDQPNGEQSDSLESKLDSLEVGEGDASTLLDQINGLGMLRDGLPLELESEDQIREAIMKGMDYTFKTQEFANERKEIEAHLEEQTTALEQRISEFEQERAAHYETLQENQIFGNILEQVKVNYPEVFQEIQLAFQQSMAMYKNAVNNPVLSQYNQKIQNLEKQLEGFQNNTVQTEATKIKTEWEDGLKQLQTDWGPKLRKLGIKMNAKEIQNVWQSDLSKKMTHKQALLAVHGEQLAKALESQQKLEKTKTTSSMRHGGAQPGKTERKSMFKGDEYLNAVMDIAKAHG